MQTFTIFLMSVIWPLLICYFHGYTDVEEESHGLSSLKLPEMVHGGS